MLLLSSQFLLVVTDAVTANEDDVSAMRHRIAAKVYSCVPQSPLILDVGDILRTIVQSYKCLVLRSYV